MHAEEQVMDDYRGVSVEPGEQLARRLLLQRRVDVLKPELGLVGAAGTEDLGHAVRAVVGFVWGPVMSQTDAMANMIYVLTVGTGIEHQT